MKKKMTWLLVLSIFIGSLLGSFSPLLAEEGGLEPLTDEEITLTYASWAQGDMQHYMAEKFMEKYPNITVEIIPMLQDTYNDDLTNLGGRQFTGCLLVHWKL